MVNLLSQNLMVSMFVPREDARMTEHPLFTQSLLKNCLWDPTLIISEKASNNQLTLQIILCHFLCQMGHRHHLLHTSYIFA